MKLRAYKVYFSAYRLNNAGASPNVRPHVDPHVAVSQGCIAFVVAACAIAHGYLVHFIMQPTVLDPVATGCLRSVCMPHHNTELARRCLVEQEFVTRRQTCARRERNRARRKVASAWNCLERVEDERYTFCFGFLFSQISPLLLSLSLQRWRNAIQPRHVQATGFVFHTPRTASAALSGAESSNCFSSLNLEHISTCCLRTREVHVNRTRGTISFLKDSMDSVITSGITFLSKALPSQGWHIRL